MRILHTGKSKEQSFTLESFFSETPIFPKIFSTSNLYQPNQEVFFQYIKHSFDAHHIANNGACKPDA